MPISQRQQFSPEQPQTKAPKPKPTETWNTIDKQHIIWINLSEVMPKWLT